MPAASENLPATVGGAGGGGRWASVFTVRRLFVSIVLAVAGACIVIAFQQSADPRTPVSLRPPGVSTVFPAEGTRVLRQERVGARLADAFTGELEIDGMTIPLDQLVRPQDPIGTDAATAVAKGLGGLNEVSFTPGTGKEIDHFRPGDHTARIFFWDRVTSTREKALDYTWHFAVT